MPHAMTDAGLMLAAQVQREASVRMELAANVLHGTMERNAQLLNDAVTRFEAAVERFILDSPNIGPS